MTRTSTGATIVSIVLAIGLLLGGTAPAAEAHPRHRVGDEKLLADLWKVSFRTEYTKESVGRDDVQIDPTGNLYLCARFDHALAPFTGAALQMSCQARPGQPLVLMGATTEWSAAEGYPTEQAMRDQAVSDIDKNLAAGYPQVLLDGRPLRLRQVITPLTFVDRIATTNLVGVVPPSRQTQFVAAAWMAVVPAPRGRHTVTFKPNPSIAAYAVIDADSCDPHH